MGSTTIGLVSDTHGWLDPELVDIFAEHDVAEIIHAGDIGDEAIIERLEEIAPVHAVRGNIDGGDLRFLPEEEFVEVHGCTIAILHIAGSPPRPKKRARELIRRDEPDVFVCGHSHIPAIDRVEETLWINPGAAGRHGFHTERLAAMLHVDEETGELSMDRIELGRRSEQ
jgi:putative phosphoesterase